MAAEAEKLINISLTKIAKSRVQRGGVSLHRNLLVATVLQKARFVFMEEAYHMVQLHDSDSSTSRVEDKQQRVSVSDSAHEVGDRDSPKADEESVAGVSDAFRNNSLEDDSEKENVLSQELIGKSGLETRICEDVSVLREKMETNFYVCVKSSNRLVEYTASSQSSLKRRRAVVADWESEEAALPILPKKVKRGEECEDSSFLEEVVAVLPLTQRIPEEEEEVISMDIDRITSLVSIFSFGGLSSGISSEVLTGSVKHSGAGETIGKLTRSVSTPDLCSAQAKEGSVVDVMQRPFLAMTV